MANEAIASGAAPALAREARANGDFSAKVIYNLAAQGDEQARQVFQTVGRMLGIALSDLVNALNLPIYVVGGGVSGAWELFSPAIFTELRQRSMVYAATAPDLPAGSSEGASAHVTPGGSSKTIITRALLGSDAGLFGAARLPMVVET
jgi:glucokinase